jgi:short-subunit dehydrogenase
MEKNREERKEERVAFITGASRGIGYAIAKRVAPLCSHLILAARTKGGAVSAAESLRNESGCEAYALWGDLARARAFSNKAADLASSTVKRVDLLVLNAGYYVEGAFSQIADADFERNMAVNCHACHYIVSSLLPFLKRSAKARIVIIGSAAAYGPSPLRLLPTYGMAKWGLRGYAVNLRQELMREKIGVTFIAPGGTLTDMWEGEDVPEGRLLEADDIARLVESLLFLSPQAVVEEIVIRPMLGDIYE